MIFLMLSMATMLSAQTLPQGQQQVELSYAETIAMNCQANLSSLYQERLDRLEVVESAQNQAKAHLKKSGMSNPKIPVEYIPYVLSEKLDKEHREAMEAKGDAFPDWESTFFLKNALPYMKACMTKTNELYGQCAKKKKKAEACVKKELPKVAKSLEDFSPFLKYLNSEQKKK